MTRASRPRGGRRRTTVVSVLGELVLTGGIVAMLFAGWQLWWNDAIMSTSQQQAATAQAQQWVHAAPVPVPVVAGALPAETAPAAGRPFGVLYVPRFGDDYHRVIAQGIGRSVLNSAESGIGHYPTSQMPGQVGNFAIASHRSANGGGLHIIEQLRVGDAIVVQTKNGWYTYRFRNFVYVQPKQVNAVSPLPGHLGGTARDRVITLTTCNPLYSTAERIVAYGVFESWRPAGQGPPASLDGTSFAAGREH